MKDTIPSKHTNDVQLTPLTLEEAKAKIAGFLKSFEIIKMKFGDIEDPDFEKLNEKQKDRILFRANTIINDPGCDDHNPIHVMRINGKIQVCYYGHDVYMAYKLTNLDPDTEVCCFTLKK